MNILIPDIWLRDFLKTKATPEQIKEYVSLCGPSVERIYGEGKNTVYDIEITGNRPDAMSVVGIAREAATILPRFGIAATLVDDPYRERVVLPKTERQLKLTLKTDPVLNPRWMSVVFDYAHVKASPLWLTRYLELAGMRSLNNVVDITNFLMRSYGQPAHVFDYDAIQGHRMTLRASKKGEVLVTLDGKKHALAGDDIVIEDGSGKLIDLCGIMGGENSSVTEKTKRVILFLQTYDPAHIRKTSMALAHRTEAATLFEKGLDTELVKPVFARGVRLMMELTLGKPVSAVTDIYPNPYKPTTVSVRQSKVRSYMGDIPNKAIRDILQSLGCVATVTQQAITVTAPSFRRDITIDVDIIEEIARIYGYQNIPSSLPERAPLMTLPDAQLAHEEEVKIRLRDWGYTEISTYSMISEKLMDLFGLDKTAAYKITNPLSEEWVYMRPTLLPSILMAIKENLKYTSTLRLFELSMTYLYRKNDLPIETPVLLVAWTGEHTFAEAKGLAEAVFSLFGLELPDPPERETTLHDWDNRVRLLLDEYGSVSQVNEDLLRMLGIHQPVTVFWVHMEDLVKRAQPKLAYRPIPKYPPIVEDLSFVVPERFHIGPLIKALKQSHPLIYAVTLLDVHENSRTLHITYQDETRNLTNEDIMPIRTKLISLAQSKFGLTLKTQ